MAHLMLLRGLHLAEGHVMASGHEDRVVAKTFVAARRPGERSVHATLEILGLSVVRPGDRQSAGEVRVVPGVWTGRFDLAPDFLHSPHPVAIALLVLRPAGREDARRTLQRIDAKAAVIGEGRETRQIGRLARIGCTDIFAAQLKVTGR